MKKGIRTFCNNDGSTSTLNQQQQNSTIDNNNHSQGDFTSKVSLSSPYNNLQGGDQNSRQNNSPTLEDLILQLELEEEMARKAKLNEYSGIRGRMSCVNNSDILRSARNALNQYPRFSLDGRDAMYRSSFGNIEEGRRRSVCSERSNLLDQENGLELDKVMLSLPTTVAGESVVWCKPGVVAKLMGLEAIPVPVNGRRSSSDSKKKEKLSAVVRRQNILRRRFERHDLERRLAMHHMQGRYHQYHHDEMIRRNHHKGGGCCSKNGYCIMKPVALEAMAGGPGSWQPRRYV